MFRWQMAEYASLAYLFPMLAVANLRRTRIVEERIPFGSHPQQYVLLCQPPERKAEALLFFAHGGGWSMGNPRTFRFIGRFFAGQGFVTVLGGYRLAPRCKFPAQVEDMVAGLQTAIQAAKERGLPANKVLLGGQSAGAQLVSLLAYDRDGLARRGLAPSLVAGLVLISGPLDFSACTNRTVARLIGDFVGDPADQDKADPIRYVRGDETLPVLCIHGDCDPLVAVQNSISFTDQVNQNGRRLAQMHIVKGAHHSDLAALFLRPSPSAAFMLKWLTARGA